MEIATKNPDISPSWLRIDASIIPSETGRSDFRSALAKAESLTRAQHTHQRVRQTGTAVALGKNKSVVFNSVGGFLQKNSATSTLGIGDAFPTPLSHSVKPGETLYGIARKKLEAQGLVVIPKEIMTSSRSLSEYNVFKDPNRIYPGQKINFPVSNFRGGELVRLPIAPLQSENVASVTPLVEDDKKTVTLPALHADSIGIDPDQPCPLTASEFFSQVKEDFRYDLKKQNVFANQYDPHFLVAVSVKTLSQLPLLAEKGLDIDALKSISPESESGNLMTSPPASSRISNLPDLIYKGALGKALDFLPMQAEDRVAMQRAGSVVSGTLTGIKLAGLLNIATPIAAVLGFLWGSFSAKNIETAETRNK